MSNTLPGRTAPVSTTTPPFRCLRRFSHRTSSSAAVNAATACPLFRLIVLLVQEKYGAVR